MNEHLLDPKFIMLVGVVILVIAVLAWLYLQKRRSTTAGLRQKFGARVRASGEAAGDRTKGRSETRRSPAAG